MDVETKAVIGEWGMKILKWGVPAFVAVGLLISLMTPTMFCGTDVKTHQTRYLVRGMLVAVQGYKQEFGSWPEDAEMYQRLEGKNDRNIVFHDPDLKYRLPDGSMSDAWKHGIIFDGIVNGQPRFHSIGKDGIDQHGAESSDDIVSWR